MGHSLEGTPAQLVGDPHQEHYQTCMASQWARRVYPRVCGEAQQQTVSELLRRLLRLYLGQVRLLRPGHQEAPS